MVVEHRRIELDYCLKCSGVWLASEELELLTALLEAGGADLSGGLFSPRKAVVNEAKRRCPICGRKMDKAWLGKEPEVLIDSCPRGDGLWFDNGELQKVIHQMEQPGNAQSSEILAFLGHAFQGTHQHGVT